MCGICGKFNYDREASVSPAVVRRMADTIEHRGPDDEGYFVSGQIGLGFRRLSIIDLSTGHQPIANEDESAWIIFNGEIYNYQELRLFLLGKGHVFRTDTDTEVILHLYEELGEGCVERLRGMFAFAIWDCRQRSLLLARDRVGIKPLYYYASETGLVFGSEIKAILADPEIQAEVNAPAIDRLLSFHYLPGEETLLQGVRKLPPGCLMIVQNGGYKIKRYWDLSFAPSGLTLREAEEQLPELLKEAMRLHLISDVPVGVLLSGGLDSTVLLSLASGMADRPLSSFTVGFSGAGVADERPYARMAAERFGTKHYEITISAAEFKNFLSEYVWHMEEPICEPPAVALHYITKLARDHVKVLISGEGGDEAFAGYPNYRNLFWLEAMKRAAGPFRGMLPSLLSAAGRLTGARKLTAYGVLAGMPFENYYYSRTAGPLSFFNRVQNGFYTPSFADLVDKRQSLFPATSQIRADLASDRVNQMLYVDTKTWLPDDLLIKADKISMGNSIELRVPFLDHRVLEFAAGLPGSYKVRGLTTKYFAKRALSHLAPPAIVRRPKAGFPVPYEMWLREDLKPWLQEVLLDQTTLQRGYFQPAAVEAILAGNAQEGVYAKELFTLAMLELWHRAFAGGSANHQGKMQATLQG